MIPSLLVIGLAVGQWWVVIAAAIGWPIALQATGVLETGEFFAAAGLALVNTAVGVGVRQGGAALIRHLRHQGPRQRPGSVAKI